MEVIQLLEMCRKSYVTTRKALSKEHHRRYKKVCKELMQETTHELMMN